MATNLGSVDDPSMIIESRTEHFLGSFRAFTGTPNPVGLTLTLTQGSIGEEGTILTLHLSRQEGVALMGHLAPAVMSAGDGSNLD